MLAKAMRVTRPADFTVVLRTGRRAGTKLLALHLLSASDGASSRVHSVPAVSPTQEPASNGSSESSASEADRPGELRPPRAGFVVSSAVGNSVVRHRISRRLREQVRPLLPALPPGTDIVVRVFPAAAAATSAELGRDLRSALHRVRSR